MNIVNLTSRIGIFLAIVMLFMILVPVLTGTDLVGLTEDNDFPDDDNFLVISHFPVAWTRIPVHQLSNFLRLGISIFALFVVYLGGRSKAKRFNDRTIELINCLIFVFSETALLCRAVFNFLFFERFLHKMNNSLIGVFLRILKPYIRRY